MFDMAYTDLYGMNMNVPGSRKATVYEFERGLLFHRGRLLRELGPGYYNFWWSKRYSILKIDTRPSSLVVGSQEVSTSEGIPVRLSVVTLHAIVDAKKYFDSARAAASAFYADLQVAIREVVATRTLDQVMADKEAMNVELRAKAIEAAARYGYEVETISVRDVSVGGEIKKAYAEVLRARKSGEAALERARGETAALRNLANAARLMADQPALAQIRALQALAESPGSTLVFGADAFVRGKSVSVVPSEA